MVLAVSFVGQTGFLTLGGDTVRWSHSSPDGQLEGVTVPGAAPAESLLCANVTGDQVCIPFASLVAQFLRKVVASHSGSCPTHRRTHHAVACRVDTASWGRIQPSLPTYCTVHQCCLLQSRSVMHCRDCNPLLLDDWQGRIDVDQVRGHV